MPSTCLWPALAWSGASVETLSHLLGPEEELKLEVREGHLGAV